MDEEEAIQRITKLLEMGGTMLATHHTCGAPLFRFRGEIICPVCSYDEVGKSPASHTPSEPDVHKLEVPPVDSVSTLQPRESQDLIESSVPSTNTLPEKNAKESDVEPLPRETIESSVSRIEMLSSGAGIQTENKDEGEMKLVEGDLRRSILHKVKELAENIEVEQDLSKLKSQLECIDGALKVLRSLER